MLINTEKLGDWLLDISKYVTTGILITSFMGEIEKRWLIYAVSLFVIFSTLFAGMWLSNRTKNKKTKSKK